MQHRRKKPLQDLAALQQNRPVQAAAAGRGAVDNLAAEHVDAIEGQREEFQPPLLSIYSQCPVEMVATVAGSLAEDCANASTRS